MPRKKPLPKVRAVDEAWFKRLMTTSLLTSAALDFACRRLQFGSASGSSPNPGPGLFPPQPQNEGKDVLSQYIGPAFISSITSELAFEDDRFDSPRVSILKALYRNSPLGHSPIRTMIVSSLLEVSYLRRTRCKESIALARALNVEVS